MRLLPSIPAAVFSGAVLTPAGLRAMHYLDQTAWAGAAIEAVWIAVVFTIPLLVSTFDFSHFRGRGLLAAFRPDVPRISLRTIYLPAWKRMAAYLVSLLLSLGLLHIPGMAPP